jgi:hypothetical protein
VQPRPLIRANSLLGGIGWISSLVLVLVLALVCPGKFLRILRELDAFDSDDFRWLRGRRHVPQRKFNAGQK